MTPGPGTRYPAGLGAGAGAGRGTHGLSRDAAYRARAQVLHQVRMRCNEASHQTRVGVAGSMAQENPTGALASSNFSEWVRENGGDEDILRVLGEHGFTSKLSLSFFDANSPDGKEMLSHVNYGQKCLLRGLIALASPSTSSSKSDPYDASIAAARNLSSRGKKANLREKLGKLFHFDTGKAASSSAGPSLPASSEHVDSDNEFQPFPAYGSQSQVKPKKHIRGKRGSYPGKGKISASGVCEPKRKVKQCRLKVVALPKPISCTPPPRDRDRWTREVWVRASASEEEVISKIQEAYQWKEREKPQFMYAQGKNLRSASLCDVEGADSWDAPTVRALMGSGNLYVLKGEAVDDSSSSSCLSDFEQQQVSCMTVWTLDIKLNIRCGCLFLPNCKILYSNYHIYHTPYAAKYITVVFRD